MSNVIKKFVKSTLGSLYYNIYKKNRISLGNRCLIYHAFGSKLKHDTYGISISMKKFEEHIKFISDNYRICKIDEIPSNDFCISLSIDDGYICTLDAIQLLENYKIPVTLFITIDTIDKPKYLTSKDLLSINDLSNVTICSHGYTHKKLGLLSHDIQLTEIIQSKEYLEEKINVSIPGISFPHGSYNDDTLDILDKSNYKFAASSKKGINTSSTNKYLLCRNEIISSDTVRDLNKKILGYYDFY